MKLAKIACIALLCVHASAGTLLAQTSNSAPEKTKEQKISDLDGPTGDVMAAAARSLVVDKDLFLKRLKDSSGDVRFKTMWALWEITVPYFYATDLADPAASLLSDPEARVRAETIGFFYAMKSTQYKDKIARLLADPDKSVRNNALIYIGWTKDSFYKPNIQTLLNDPDADIRKLAGETLDKMK